VRAAEQNFGTAEPASRIPATDADSGCDIVLSSAPHSPFFGAASVMDSSVYHLASALIGRCVGRMAPRSSMILHRAHILLPGG
jgi:hypothetical protein